MTYPHPSKTVYPTPLDCIIQATSLTQRYLTFTQRVIIICTSSAWLTWIFIIFIFLFTRVIVIINNIVLHFQSTICNSYLIIFPYISRDKTNITVVNHFFTLARPSHVSSLEWLHKPGKSQETFCGGFGVHHP